MRCHRVITPTPKHTQPSTLGFSRCLRIKMSKSMIPINFSINVGMERTISHFVNISSPVVVVSFGF